MGRAKLSMELISKEKSRNTTFQKRKKGLKKKMYEFSTLCDVDACMIIYGPDQNERPVEPETWPANPDEVRRIINRYKDKSKEEREKRTFDLSDFFVDRKKKVEEELMKLRRKNGEAKYPTWDDRINGFSEDQLRELLSALHTRLEGVKTKMEIMKGNQCLMEGTASGMIDCSHSQSSQNHSHYTQGLLQRGMELEAIHQQSISSVKPLDFHVPVHYPTDQAHQALLPFDPSPMMMMMNDNYNCTQFGGASSSNIQYNPFKGSLYYDAMPGMLENMMFNNPRPPMCYYSPTMQPMPPHLQCPMMPSVSSRMHASQLNEYYDINEIQTNNKKTEYY